jgi:flagellar biosynthetic protein FliR
MNLPWAEILSLVLASLRAVGVVMVLPLPGGRGLPPMLRVALAVLLGAVVGPVAHPGGGEVPTTSPELALAAFHEVMLGLGMGFVGRALLSSAELAGRLIATEIGLVAAPGMDAPVPASEPLPAFIGLFTGMMFFLMRAHETVLAAFGRSFQVAQVGAGALAPGSEQVLVEVVSQLIEISLRIAAPFIALNFVITLSFSILGRAVPKMNVFILSYSLRSQLGFLLLAGGGTLLARYLAILFETMPWRMLELVGSRS